MDFYGIKHDLKYEYIVNKSRFIGYGFFVENEQQVEVFIKKIKKENSDAKHICYAYSIDNSKIKVSDNGEPQGTDGLPILDVINKNNLTNVLIIVVRYFGGIKLGVGGLTRAYSTCASETIKTCGVKKYVDCTVVQFYVDFGEQKYIENLEKQEYIKKVEFEFDLNVIVKCYVLSAEILKLKEFLNVNLSRNIQLIELKNKCV